ncbi:PIG-L deacetylase family protein [Clostridium disporicum]|uniref:N-acetylglucosaminylphosphatidylinositol deacetylase family protein n=1 Tax=Clostridium disporicum TaxID=84024 RepID=A0A174EPK5_9CLOT|nr:PIG-L family deacetylase [Clostridium disporicum]CUO38506.1 N-acetylglucosaminylphosphatidylinositol deacetylase family protein [Clostridium disporicum]
MKRVIVISPHPDDEVIGCGGTILKHIRNGDRVFVVFITTGELEENNSDYKKQCEIRKEEAVTVAKQSGMEILYWSGIPARKIRDNFSDIEKDLVKIFRYIKPNVIYVPHADEKDNDHVLTYNLVKEAYCMSKIKMENLKTNTVPAVIRGYEVWSPLKDIHISCDISPLIKKKKELIDIYASQIKQINYGDGIVGLNRYRAIFNGVDGHLEVFSIISV